MRARLPLGAGNAKAARTRITQGLPDLEEGARGEDDPTDDDAIA